MLSVLINTQMLQQLGLVASRSSSTSSSACVYNADMQRDVNNPGLREERCIPGDARGRLRLGEALQ